MTRNPNAPLPEYPDHEGYELCPRCGARLDVDRNGNLRCIDCEMHEAAEREMEEEGRMHP